MQAKFIDDAPRDAWSFTRLNLPMRTSRGSLNAPNRSNVPTSSSFHIHEAVPFSLIEWLLSYFAIAYTGSMSLPIRTLGPSF
jgi:hypothetical protein